MLVFDDEADEEKNEHEFESSSEEDNDNTDLGPVTKCFVNQ